MKFILISLLFMGLPQEQWELKKDKDGIKVYTRSVEYSGFNEAKGHIVIINTNLQELIKVITDVNAYESLLYESANPKLISEVNDSVKIFYMQQKAPWPVDWRDGVYKQMVSIDNKKMTAILKFEVIDYDWPIQPDIVRLNEGRGLWQLQQIENDVKVIYTMHGEPSGNVPAWLANSFVVNQPFQTLNNLKNIVK